MRDDRQAHSQRQRSEHPAWAERLPQHQRASQGDQEWCDAAGDRVREGEFPAPVGRREEAEVDSLCGTRGDDERPYAGRRESERCGKQEHRAHERSDGGGGHAVGGAMKHAVPCRMEDSSREHKGKGGSAHQPARRAG